MDVSMFLVQQTKVVKRVGGIGVLMAWVQRPASLHILGESSRICLILRQNSQCPEQVPTWGLSLLKAPINASIIRKLLLRHYAKFKI